MGKLGRPGMSDEEKRGLWDRWKRGESVSEIAVALGTHPGSVFGVLKSNGGFVPPVRKHKPGSLTLAEREDISRGLAGGESLRAIARGLGRPASTVSREVSRHGGRKAYRAHHAQERAQESARRPQACALAKNGPLREIVAAKLADKWSPQQIAGHLKRAHPRTDGMYVCHETIYQSLFIQARGVLGKELQKYLRSRRPIRKNIHHSVKGQCRSQIKGAVSIRERPAEVAGRAIPGHWEGDLILGTGQSQIATLVERTTRFSGPGPGPRTRYDLRDRWPVHPTQTDPRTNPENLDVGSWDGTRWSPPHHHSHWNRHLFRRPP